MICSVVHVDLKIVHFIELTGFGIMLPLSFCLVNDLTTTLKIISIRRDQANHGSYLVFTSVQRDVVIFLVFPGTFKSIDMFVFFQTYVVSAMRHMVARQWYGGAA